MKAQNLYEQLSEVGAQSVALLLGFSIEGKHDTAARGFRLNLQDIPPFTGEFTIGEALNAYVDSLTRIR
jgi:hypothetical protein